MGHLTRMQTLSTYPKGLTFSVETHGLNHKVPKTPFSAWNSFGLFAEIAPTLSKYSLLQTILKPPNSGVLKPCHGLGVLFFDKTLDSLHFDFFKPNVSK